MCHFRKTYWPCHTQKETTLLQPCRIARYKSGQHGRLPGAECHTTIEQQHIKFWCATCAKEFKSKMQTVFLEQESGVGWSNWVTERRERAEMFWEAGEEIEAELREWFKGAEDEKDKRKAEAKRTEKVRKDESKGKQIPRGDEEARKGKEKDSGRKRGGSFLRFFKAGK